MMQFSCPNCFAELAPDVNVCPACGTDSTAWEATHTYEERLIHALGHPLSETRMASIISLGNRGDPAAAMPLAHCALAYPDDVVQNLEIVRSIDEMPAGPGRERALDSLRQHPARPIRRAVAGVLGVPFEG